MPIFPIKIVFESFLSSISADGTFTVATRFCTDFCLLVFFNVTVTSKSSPAFTVSVFMTLLSTKTTGADVGVSSACVVSAAPEAAAFGSIPSATVTKFVNDFCTSMPFSSFPVTFMITG